MIVLLRIVVLSAIVIIIVASFAMGNRSSDSPWGPSPVATHDDLCQTYTIDLSGYEACDDHDLCNLTDRETSRLISLRKFALMECRRNSTEIAFDKMNKEAKLNEGV